jgi:hypothetical protein
MSLFDSLLVAHLVGDWLLQTEWQALNKTKNWRAMWTHVAVNHLIILIVLWVHFGFQDTRVYVAVAALALSHAYLDRRWPEIAIMRALRIIVDRDPERWLLIAVDQCLHIVLLALAALYLSQ